MATTPKPDGLPWTGPPGSSGNPIQDIWNTSVDTPAPQPDGLPWTGPPGSPGNPELPPDGLPWTGPPDIAPEDGGVTGTNQIYRHPNNPSLYFNSDGSIYNGTPVYSGGPGNWEQTGWSDNPGPGPDLPPDGLPWTGPPGSPGNPGPQPDGLPVQPPGNGNAQVVPGPADPNDPNQINVVDYAGNLVTDPKSGFSDDMLLSENLPGFTDEQRQSGEIADLEQPDYDRLNQQAGQATTATATAHQGQTSGANAAQAGTAQATASEGQTSEAQYSEAQTAQAEQHQAEGQVADQVDPRKSAEYEAAQTFDQVAQQDMQGAVGEVDPRAVIEAPQIDTEAIAEGVSGTGEALKDFASLDISNIIDTSTAAGKALAAQLGEGNYTDSKATLKGQLEILQSEFEGPNGEAKIPSWAAGTARNVSKIAAFKGMTGTAATAAMAQALLESSIAVAQQDAQFFQTVTIQNLNNKQQATINRANVLAQMDMANLDSRTAAAVQNSKNFMDMSLANLSNEQQARILNTQNRVQSILEDAKEKNVASRFNIEQGNQTDQFYDSLNASINQFNAAQFNALEQFNAGQRSTTDLANMAQQNAMNQFNAEQRNTISRFNSEQENLMSKFNAQERNAIEQFNASQSNSMAQFNTSERNAIERFNAEQNNLMSQFNAHERNVIEQYNATQKNQTSQFNVSQENSMKQFNAQLEDAREQFYLQNQYNVDVANAKWRQELVLTENRQAFEAAALDVKNMVGVSQEQLNRIWDRSDSLLDYIWKSAENELDRDAAIAMAHLNAKLQSSAESKKGIGSIIGTIAGSLFSKLKIF